MKLSKREKQLLDIIQQAESQSFTVDWLMPKIMRRMKPKPKNPRKAVIASLRKLRLKLEVYGVDIVLSSPLGRGRKAQYLFSGNLRKMSL